MIDFGLLTLFTLQIAMVLAVYHVWSGIKRETKDVLAMKADVAKATEAGNAAKADLVELAKEVEERVRTAEGVPSVLVKRVSAMEESLKVSDRTLATHGERITSVGARLSSHLREFKRLRGDAGPASEDEDAIPPSAESSPGPLFEQAEETPVPGTRPGFGVLKRRVG